MNEELLAKVFTEWDRRYRENPELYMDTVTHLLKETPYSYGNACAVYFNKLAREMGVL